MAALAGAGDPREVTDVDLRPAPGHDPHAGRRAGAHRRSDLPGGGGAPAAGRRGLLGHRRGRDVRGHAAVVASRPDRRGRARRGGAAARRLRQHPRGAAARAGRAGADRLPATAPTGLAGAGRGRVRRGRASAVRVRRRRPTGSGSMPATRAARRCGWPTRCRRTRRTCARRCLLGCSPRSCATPAGAGPTSVCSKPGSCSAGRPGPAAASTPPPVPSVLHRPSDEEIRALDAELPSQPRHAAVILCGLREPAGWWGAGRPADWADAVAAARTVARAVRCPLDVTSGAAAPFHPGRCAELRIPVRDGAAPDALHRRRVRR